MNHNYSHCNRLSLLIAEDDANQKKLLDIALRSHFSVLSLAKDGIQTQKLYKTKQPDMLLNAIKIPQMNGLE